MYLISDLTKDHRHPKTTSGAYEWWYFDVFDDQSDMGMVIIFYDGLLFSPDYHIDQQKGDGALPEDHPGISISLYHKNKTLFYALKAYSKHRSFFSDSDCEVKIGNNSLKVDHSNQLLDYSIHLDERLPNNLHLTGNVHFSAIKNPSRWINEDSKDNHHFWNLVHAKTRVIADLQLGTSKDNLRRIGFSGLGYHDHNLGSRPIDGDFDQWYWGRIHLDGNTLVWYIMCKGNDTQRGVWIINDIDGKVSPLDDIRFNKKPRKSVFGLAYHDELEVSIDGQPYRIKTNYIWDNGPFYLRYNVCLIDGQGRQVNGSKSGIAEYIKPDRISKKWVRPMIRVRYHHDEINAHWIQKSLLLSKWTW